MKLPAPRGLSLATLATRPPSDNVATPADIEAIAQIGMEHAPLEACGLLLLGVGIRVIQNMSPHPESNSLMKADDILDAVLFLTRDEPGAYDLANDMIVWHTHPGGQQGPSTVDVETREANAARRLMVVAIPGGEAVEY